MKRILYSVSIILLFAVIAYGAGSTPFGVALKARVSSGTFYDILRLTLPAGSTISGGNATMGASTDNNTVNNLIDQALTDGTHDPHFSDTNSTTLKVGGEAFSVDSSGNVSAPTVTATTSLNTYMDGNLTVTKTYMPYLPGKMISNADCDGNCTVLLTLGGNSTNDGRSATFRYDDNDTGTFKVCPTFSGDIIEGCTAGQCLKLDTTLGSFQGLRVCRRTDTLYQFCSWGTLGSHTCVAR